MLYLITHSDMFVKCQSGYIKLQITAVTGPDGTVAKSSANGWLGTEFASQYCGSNPQEVFKGPMGRCKATTHSFLSLTSHRVTANY